MTKDFKVIKIDHHDIYGTTPSYLSLMDKLEYQDIIYRVISFSQAPHPYHHSFRARKESLFPENFKQIGLSSSGEDVWMTLGGEKWLSDEEYKDYNKSGTSEDFKKKYQVVELDYATLNWNFD